MRAYLMTVVALPLLVFGIATAQDRPTPATSSYVANAPSKPITVLGKVSDDGRILLTDIDSEWTVSNPNVLKGYEGSVVRIRCYVDSESGRIRVVTARKEEGGLKYAAQFGDSAFRR
jgi:hypothetical protein